MITNKEPSFFCDRYAEDLLECFPDIEIKELIKAIDRGVRGEFGVTYVINGTVLYDWVKRHGTMKYDHTKIKNGDTYVQRFIRNKIDPRDDKEVAIFIEEEGLPASNAELIKSHFTHTPELFPYVKD